MPGQETVGDCSDQLGHIKKVGAFRGQGALDGRLILILVLFLSPPLNVYFCVEYCGLNMTVVKTETQFLPYSILFPYLPQTTFILNSILLILIEPIKSSSLWCNFASPNGINHLKVQTHKTPKGVKVN